MSRELILNIGYNATIIVVSILVAVKTVSQVLKLPGSRFRKTVTGCVLFVAVLGWLATAVLGAFDDFDYPLIGLENYVRVMYATLLFMFILFYIYVSSPARSESDKK